MLKRSLVKYFGGLGIAGLTAVASSLEARADETNYVGAPLITSITPTNKVVNAKPVDIYKIEVQTTPGSTNYLQFRTSMVAGENLGHYWADVASGKADSKGKITYEPLRKGTGEGYFRVRREE